MLKKHPYKNKPYHYRPKSLSGTDWKSLRVLFLSLLGITLVLAFLYFFAVKLFSNIDLFWRILRPGSTEVAERHDRIPPPPPLLQSLPKATNEDSLAVSGFSEPGARVALFLNSSKIDEILVDSEGGFSFEQVALSEEENRIYVQACDQAGNESKPSNECLVIYDKKPPELVIESPVDGTKIEKEEERQTEFRGTTEPGTQLTIGGFWARVDEEGKFSHLFRLEEGKHKIEVVAKDEAGNETKVEVTVTYEPPEED